MGLRRDKYDAWAARWRVSLGLTLSIAYLGLAQPTIGLLVAGGAVALVGLALRAWAAGHLEKGASLATAGPYALTRNPLYLGSGLIGAGFAIAGRSVVIAVAFAALLIFIYAPVIRREEEFLRVKFGEHYRRYAEHVPLLLPRPGVRLASAERFRWSRYKHNREYEAALGYVAAMGLLTLKMMLRRRLSDFL
ncbi:MAG TPA: isoprenylcysteine carboxylmethyltransferase family protein [Terriglobia bacterium]